jgi:pimeloyl-ACP methyl ester carboxylesterase
METKPNIVLVHGAFADGSSWSRVIPLLATDGYNVIAVQNPLTSLEDDIANTRRVIDALDGPVVLVGHSYGGAVISGAAHGAANVISLVYIAAFAPDEGEALGQDIYGRYPPLPSGQYFQPDATGNLYIDRTHFHECFAHDVDRDQANVMAAAQKPIAASIFGVKAGPAAWHNIPAWYQISEDDGMIPPDAQRWMADRIGAKTISLKSSHASLVSHPQEIAELIKQAATAGTPD